MQQHRELYWPTYKPDYQLIPREEEELWCQRAKENQHAMRIIDPHVKMPVLLKVGARYTSWFSSHNAFFNWFFSCSLKELYKEHLRTRGENVPDEPRLKLPVRLSHNNRYRLAEEGETPNQKLADKFGTPVTPALYENIDAARHLFSTLN